MRFVWRNENFLWFKPDERREMNGFWSLWWGVQMHLTFSWSLFTEERGRKKVFDLFSVSELDYSTTPTMTMRMKTSGLHSSKRRMMNMWRRRYSLKAYSSPLRTSTPLRISYFYSPVPSSHWSKRKRLDGWWTSCYWLCEDSCLKPGHEEGGWRGSENLL